MVFYICGNDLEFLNFSGQMFQFMHFVFDRSWCVANVVEALTAADTMAEKLARFEVCWWRDSLVVEVVAWTDSLRDCCRWTRLMAALLQED